MTRRLAVALIAAALLLSGPVLASQKRSFSSGTLGVRVDVLVTDGRNPVGGLTAADFELRDNGVVQTIDLVDTSDIPINAVLALDTSASIQGQRQKDLIAASQALLDGLKPIDRAALATFSHAVARIALTSDLGGQEGLLSHRAVGETAIMDRTHVRADGHAGADRPLGSSSSALTATTRRAGCRRRKCSKSAKRSNAAFMRSPLPRRRRSPLKDLTDATGGLLQVASGGTLRGAFRKSCRTSAALHSFPIHRKGSRSGFICLDVRVKRRG